MTNDDGADIEPGAEGAITKITECLREGHKYEHFFAGGRLSYVYCPHCAMNWAADEFSAAQQGATDYLVMLFRSLRRGDRIHVRNSDVHTIPADDTERILGDEWSGTVLTPVVSWDREIRLRVDGPRSLFVKITEDDARNSDCIVTKLA
ncbi:MAG: hypothetical protein GEU98_15230 [Pseudonocardiaceae bacterium]|nr:hypothetical protein [Pseudonocardiaceae bacterium]